MPPEQTSSALAAALNARTNDMLGSIGSDVLGLKSSGALFIGVLRSRTAQDDLVNKFNLCGAYGVRDWNAARLKLERNTDIAEDRKSGIITIRVRDKSRERAQQMSDEYIATLDRLVEHVATSSARREREFLEQRLAVVKRDLDSAALSLSKFASINTAVDIPVQAKAMVEGAATLQAQVISAEAELKGLEQAYGIDNTRVREVQARLGELRRQLRNMAADDGGGSVSTGSPPIYPSIRQLPLLGVTYTDLYRRVKIEESVYETLTKQYELAKVQEAKEIPSVRVLDQPDLPGKHVYPNRKLIVFGGSFFGMLLGVAWVLASAVWQKLGPEDPRREFVVAIHEVMLSDAARLHVKFTGRKLHL
jgi:uncharacterized protein involved in exopolysaccharide biosynthesis